STTSMLCLSKKLLFIGDDYCLLSSSSEGPYAHSVYSTGKLTLDSYYRWSSIWETTLGVKPLKGDKVHYFLYPENKNLIKRKLPLKVIIVPSISDSRETSFKKITQSEALTSLAPSSLFQVPGSGHDEFRFFASLVKSLPS